MTVIAEIILIAVVLVIVIAFATKGRFIHAVKNRVKAAADDLTESVRDPVADGQMAIAEAEEEVEQLKTERRIAREDILLLNNDLKTLQEEVDKYENLAKAAGAAGNKTHVTRALELKNGYAEELSLLQAQLTELNTLVASITESIDDREAEIKAAKGSAKTMVRTLRFHQIKTRISQSKTNRNGPNASLERLKQDTKAAQAKSQVAHEEATRLSPDEELEAAYTPNSSVTEEDVSKYMAKE